MKLTKILLSTLSGATLALTLSACGAASSNSAANNTVTNQSNAATVVNTNQTAANNAATPVSNTAANSRSKTETFTPAKDSPERTAIMDALRVPVGKELKQPVIFTVDKLKV